MGLHETNTPTKETIMNTIKTALNSKTMRTMDFLIKNDQNGLAWRLYKLEVIRTYHQLRQNRLDRAKARNRARWNELKIDIDHFILIKNEKG